MRFNILIFITLLFSFSNLIAQNENNYQSDTLTKLSNNNGNFTDLRDNKTYKTIIIGEQEWFAENFAYMPFVCDLDSNNCGVWVYNYSGSELEQAKITQEYKNYGCLYSWDQAKKLCPEGWRLPTEEDWIKLEKYIGINGLENDSLLNHISWRGEKHADLLKKGGETGFDILFAGWRAGTGRFNNIGIHANFWVDSETSNYGAIERLFNLNSGKIGKYWGNKNCGFSVRYIKTNK